MDARDFFETDKYMSKLVKMQEDAEEDIFSVLEEVSYKYQWEQDHILELYCTSSADYEEALEILGMELPTNAQSMFGVRSENLVVIQFDRI